MDLSTSFLIYATLFRLSVIAAGVLIIVLGYRLFLRGLAPGDDTDTTLEGGVFKLSLKNAAPGTTFALFGAVLISVMIVQGSPELDVTNAPYNDVQMPAELQVSSLRLRGEGQAAIAQAARLQLQASALAASEQLLGAGSERELQGDWPGAQEAYRLAISMPGLPAGQLVKLLNQLAWGYQQQAQPDLALPLALFALQIEPDNVVLMDTLARVYGQMEQFEDAQALLDRVLAMDPGNDDAKATAAWIRQQQASLQ